MTQFDFGTIDPDTKSGPSLADDLMDQRDALHTLHRGATRPTYVQPGMMWIQEVSGTRWDLMIFISVALGDLKLGEINPTTGVWDLYVRGGTFTQTPVGPSSDPATDDAFARKAYVDAKVGTYYPSGTTMLFVQSAAPTGWTKSTAHNDKALRVVSGSVSSGGTLDFSAAFAAARGLSGTVENTTLTESQMPTHWHSVVGIAGDGSFGPGGAAPYPAGSSTTGATGGSQPHNHILAMDNLDMAVKYVDAIIAARD